jgi:hypothetical protein
MEARLLPSIATMTTDNVDCYFYENFNPNDEENNPFLLLTVINIPDGGENVVPRDHDSVDVCIMQLLCLLHVIYLACLLQKNLIFKYKTGQTWKQHLLLSSLH